MGLTLTAEPGDGFADLSWALMSFVSEAEVRALVDTDLLSAALQAVIDREEAELALLIGPLEGERTEVFLLTSDMAYDTVRLRRTTDAVAVIDNGVAVDAADVRMLADQRSVIRFLTATGNPYARGYWLGPLEVTYEPNDAARVKRVIIELVGIGLSASGSSVAGDIVSETTGTYSYTLGRTAATAMTPEQRRRALIWSLLPRQLPTSVRIRSSVIGTRPLLGTVRPA